MVGILSAKKMERFVGEFNRNDLELYRQHIPNERAAEWMRNAIPLFECPDPEIETSYYFRWWTFRKHIRQTPEGYVITEFLPPVPWAGPFNTISCALGHHFREGRWLRDDRYLVDYARFWLRGGGELRTDPETNRGYSCWIADSVLALAEVTSCFDLCRELLPDLMANYEAWERTHRDPNALFWQRDIRDGMEYSISGQLAPDGAGYRATINSYMFGDAMAISKIAEQKGDFQTAIRFREKAEEIRRLMQVHLWDSEARFYKVVPRTPEAKRSDARELHGYTPWYFHLPAPAQSDAWRQLMDPKGFYAPFGPTTAEQRHRGFRVCYSWKGCQWNGPSWPYATSVTLTALANLLIDYRQDVMTPEDFFEVLKIYTRSHRLQKEDGRTVPWIDENLNPFTGDWLTRTTLKRGLGTETPGWRDGEAFAEKGQERGKDYNHSTYCDLIINGLMGIRPHWEDRITVAPLAPPEWDYFCLDGLPYHGRELTVLWDRTGERYGKGRGFRVFVDGRLIGEAESLHRLDLPLQKG